MIYNTTVSKLIEAFKNDGNKNPLASSFPKKYYRRKRFNRNTKLYRHLVNDKWGAKTHILQKKTKCKYVGEMMGLVGETRVIDHLKKMHYTNFKKQQEFTKTINCNGNLVFIRGRVDATCIGCSKLKKCPMVVEIKSTSQKNVEPTEMEKLQLQLYLFLSRKTNGLLVKTNFSTWKILHVYEDKEIEHKVVELCGKFI